jgi:hypothetical protein
MGLATRWKAALHRSRHEQSRALDKFAKATTACPPERQRRKRHPRGGFSTETRRSVICDLLFVIELKAHSPNEPCTILGS